jgi:TonB family protein
MQRAGMSVLVASLLLATAIDVVASAQEQTPGPPASADATQVRKGGRMDVKHPLRIGSDYYPKESMKHREQGRCLMAFYIEADGTVPAAQLLKSTGFPRLDVACFESVIGVPLIPPTVNGEPVAGWYDFNLVWLINKVEPYKPLPQGAAFPRMAPDYQPQFGEKFYPEGAKETKEQGYCIVRITVSSGGAALNPAIARFSGSATLDNACLAALKDARFTPALQDGHPVADSTLIAIYW